MRPRCAAIINECPDFVSYKVKGREIPRLGLVNESPNRFWRMVCLADQLYVTIGLACHIGRENDPIK